MDLSSLKVKSDYDFKITNFEGPLDLLLHLIKDAKIEIKDIFISEVTTQYLAYMEQVDLLDMEKASDFLDVAATLLEIKSNSMLPKIEDVITDYVDEGELLKRRLVEYQLMREMSEKLKECEDVDRFFRSPDNSVGNVRIVLTDFNIDNLITAFSKLLVRFNKKSDSEHQTKEIRKERWTLSEKIHFVKIALKENETISFIELFESDSTKGEIITTFLAVLEILKEQYAYAEQKSEFGEIFLHMRNNTENTINEEI